MDHTNPNSCYPMGGSEPFGLADGPSAHIPIDPYELAGKRVVLLIGNTWIEVRNGHDDVIAALDRELRYPTATALAMERGFLPPDDNGWDGWIRLVKKLVSGIFIPTGLLNRTKRVIESLGVPLELDDKRERPLEGCPDFFEIPLRDYQKEAVRCAVDAGRGVLDMPPRAGKTRTMCEIHRAISLPTLWIAPTDRIVRQTQSVIEGWFGKNYSMHLVGSKEWEKASRMHVVVCTAATAVRLPQEFFDSREMIVVDEWHHAAAKTYKQVFAKCDHIYFRFGMTGTFFRSGHDALEMHALLSETIYKVTPEFLIEREHLVPTRVVFLPVLSPRLRNPGGNTFQSGHGKYGIQEHAWRNQMVTYAAVTLWQSGRNVLVLVGTKYQGRILKKQIEAYLPATPSGAQFDSVEFISTDTPRPIQTKILESFLGTDEVKILIGTSLLGEGVDLPSTDALVYARGEKAEVTLTQNAYRVCTKTEGKDHAIIVDFADRHHKKLFQHSMERLRVYHAEPTFEVKVLQDPHEFGAWLEREMP